jgi:pyrroloquinoline quinone biosynthesis protein B
MSKKRWQQRFFYCRRLPRRIVANGAAVNFFDDFPRARPFLLCVIQLIGCIRRPAGGFLANSLSTREPRKLPAISLIALTFFSVLMILHWAAVDSEPIDTQPDSDPYLLVLGIAQDGGTPQAGTREHPGWTDQKFRRRVVSLAVVDPVTDERWLFEATPDFREQLQRLDQLAPVRDRPGIAGIFLSHAHIGHYTGLMFLGHESMGAKGIPVYVMPRMAEFLRNNGPWSQLVRYQNIVIRTLNDDAPVRLNERLTVAPFLVPHRQEYSEVVGFHIQGPNRSVLFIPDIDSWEAWDEMGVRIEDMIAAVDVAYLDGTFFANGEIPGRDMSGFPHPFISHSMQRFENLEGKEKAKIRFIHLNHSNSALWPDSDARASVIGNGFQVAEEGERVDF